jgi:TRAP-type mannitol/chloroaromatic compound transport system substrate-binding protein
VTLEAFPRPVIEAARKATTDIVAAIGETSPIARRIVTSYAAAQNDLRSWSALSADMARALARSGP